jgi:ABC-type Zn uptake system ZnuABC Zn-binding protein ZnuA
MNTICNRLFLRIFLCFVSIFFLVSPGYAAVKKEKKDKKNLQDEQPLVLASTFPIYQITRNVAAGRPVTVDLMLPAELGCPHDYALTPQDMMKLSKAKSLVVNGLGMEEFMTSAFKKNNPSMTVIDSSKGITNLLTYMDDDHGHGGNHGHMKANPHLFVSPRMVSLLALNIASGLTRIDPAGAGIYQQNAKAYGARMIALDQRCREIGKKLMHKQIMTQHGVFDYLARDMGLTIGGVLEVHGGKESSASEMLHLINVIKSKKIRAIFIEPQYSSKVALALAKETGVRVATLDPGATGPMNVDLNYYETLMDKNLKILESNLGALSND